MIFSLSVPVTKSPLAAVRTVCKDRAATLLIPSQQDLCEVFSIRQTAFSAACEVYLPTYKGVEEGIGRNSRKGKGLSLIHIYQLRKLNFVLYIQSVLYHCALFISGSTLRVNRVYTLFKKELKWTRMTSRHIRARLGGSNETWGITASGKTSHSEAFDIITCS